MRRLNIARRRASSSISANRSRQGIPTIDRLESRQLMSAVYSVNVFGPAGNNVDAEAINDSGTVAGSFNNNGASNHLFTYSNGQFKDLGSLPGYNDQAITFVAINNAGQIIGNQGPDCFLYSGGKMIDLGKALGGADCNVIAVNSSGEVVGNYLLANGNLDGFVYNNGKVTDIGSLGGMRTFPYAINDSGVVVGGSETKQLDSDGNVIEQAFSWANGKMTDLEAPGRGGRAFGINNTGTIVGEDDGLAFQYNSGKLTDLSLFNSASSRASAINATGQITGFYTLPSGGEDTFLYANGVAKDLGSLGGLYTLPDAMNNLGDVVGVSDSQTTDRIPVLYHAGALYPIATLGDPALLSNATFAAEDFGSSQAINNHGQIIGETVNSQGVLLTPAVGGSISGTVFNDTDADGVQNHGEKGIAGWTVYEDADSNGIFNSADDPSAKTNALGQYKFTNVAPGPYTLRIVPPNTSWRAIPQSFTLASGQNVAGRNFATLPYYSYSVTDLGTLGGQFSMANGINDAGEVVGEADTKTADSIHAFLYNPTSGKLTDLGTFGGANSYANGINNLGQIVGSADTTGTDAEGGTVTKAFLYSNGKLINLGTLPGDQSSEANAINDAGQIVGYSSFFEDNPYGPAFTGFDAFLYSGGKLQAISPPASSGLSDGDATAINAAGQIAGYFALSDPKDPGQEGAFLDIGGKIQILETLADQSGIASNGFPLNNTAAAINNAGQVVGQSDTGIAGSHAVLYSGGKVVDLGTLNGADGFSFAAGINNNGWIVGQSDSSDFSSQLAFLDVNNQLINLNDTLPAHSGWTLTGANAINASNQIVGAGVNAQGQTHAYLLTPRLASISGTVFNNLNGDGKTAANPAPGGWQVYADLKNTGSYAPGDPTATTDSSGHYTLTGLNAGGYTIRVVPKTGYRMTAPGTFSETLVAAGQSVTGPSFGEVAVGPYLKAPAAFGLIQAENFDLGGLGSAYNSNNLNQGGLYRPSEGIGIGAIPTASGGGYFVGYTNPGEWIDYTVNVAATGTYTLNFRVASGVAGNAFQLNVDGVNVTGTLAIPNLGWNTYTTVAKTGVHLTAGTHVLRLVIDSTNTSQGSGNFDWIQAVKTG